MKLNLLWIILFIVACNENQVPTVLSKGEKESTEVDSVFYISKDTLEEEWSEEEWEDEDFYYEIPVLDSSLLDIKFECQHDYAYCKSKAKSIQEKWNDKYTSTLDTNALLDSAARDFELISICAKVLINYSAQSE